MDQTDIRGLVTTVHRSVHGSCLALGAQVARGPSVDSLNEGSSHRFVSHHRMPLAFGLLNR